MYHQKLNQQQIKAIHIQIGKNVKNYRKAKGLTQLALSTELGYQSASPIAMAETNYRGKHFNIEHLANIAKCLNIGVVDLLTGVDELL